MKTLFLLMAAMIVLPASVWMTSLEAAKKEAAAKHRLILLNFSGSDWCVPCIRLKKEIFESLAFQSLADTALILVNADFPRSSRHALSKEQVAQNERLADQYDVEGKFPFTLLLDPEGHVLKEWDGFPAGKPQDFIGELKNLCDAHR